MTEPTRPESAECLHCGVTFTPTKAGHLYCKPEHRHSGPRKPEDRRPLDPEAVERLFARDRDPDERVRPDDWFPGSPEFAELYLADTVAARRRWYANLLIARR